MLYCEHAEPVAVTEREDKQAHINMARHANFESLSARRKDVTPCSLFAWVPTSCWNVLPPSTHGKHNTSHLDQQFLQLGVKHQKILILTNQIP
jgi:hypothetical protein